MDLIEALNWRYATKKYDETKKVSEDDLSAIKEAVRLTPTSYGLQLFTVIDVRSDELKEKLVPASWGQQQAITASHFMVFCVPSKLSEEHIDGFVQLKAEASGVNVDDLKGYGDFIKSKKIGLSDEENAIWLAKQAYIGLGLLMTAAAEKQIDATPMEGFEENAVSEVLGLEAKGLKPVVLAALGYRSDEDQTQHQPKVRRSMDELFQIA